MKNRDYLIVMKEILQMIDEGVHVVDPEGNSVVYNRSMAMLEKMESRHAELTALLASLQ